MDFIQTAHSHLASLSNRKNLCHLILVFRPFKFNMSIDVQFKSTAFCFTVVPSLLCSPFLFLPSLMLVRSSLFICMAGTTLRCLFCVPFPFLPSLIFVSLLYPSIWQHSSQMSLLCSLFLFLPSLIFVSFLYPSIQQHSSQMSLLCSLSLFLPSDICQVFIHPYGRHSSQMSPRIVTLGLCTLYIPLPLSAHRAREWDGILLPLLGHTTWGLLRKLSSKINLPAIQEPLETQV